ncbi:Polyadenylation factor subunit 2 [Penicillium atrosanguineum]|uniref:Polyadenylation factor subunit 2 n=1 Tax=Penicillium atrosanguineum TaxID=1132637 RepID=UPI00238F9817|nr:Polyadenylation factor subunit 2 [Penicillium atrosanguineum]KAJ5310624.1 Polyadenylation factor subunit 2 [Penicillium atrosanguineum]
MATERSLAALLRSLQTTSSFEDASGLLPTATSFLSILGNPLNLSLLASQLLSAPALWNHPVDLHACRKILSVFNTAAIAVLQNDTEEEAQIPHGRHRKIEREAWVKAVVEGADDKSPRWRHMLLLGGILLGFEGQNRQGLPRNTRVKLESALATAAQLALEELDPNAGVDGHCVTMVLNYTFELLSDMERSNINYDLLLPVMIRSTYLSPEGLEGGYFLGAIDKDVVEVPGRKFRWAANSATFGYVSAIGSRPLVSALGPLSRLASHAVENVRDPKLVAQTIDYLADFVRTLMVQWRQNKLSEIDVTEETEFLEPESMKTTIPTLWKVLRNCLYSVVIILRAVLGRTINDPALAAGSSAPYLSMQSLHILRNLYFISSRTGQNASSQQTFVFLAAIDILSQYPDLTENFLRSIKPSDLGQIPDHPVERCLDIFFLNVAEHFPLVLSPEANEELLLSAAFPYLAAGANSLLLEIFEAAHSLVLVVFAIPHNADLAAKHLPFYIENLFAVFPENLSARQFRLAFKTVIQVTAPPSPLANSQPLLPSILLEVVRDRALHASTTPIPPTVQNSSTPDLGKAPPLSAQAVLTLALIDSLSFLRVDDLKEWLPLTAELINAIPDPAMRQACVDRFWEALSGGEMDVDRAHCCVAWWSTRGGRELLLFGAQPAPGAVPDDDNGPYMSGAVGGVAPEHKL